MRIICPSSLPGLDILSSSAWGQKIRPGFESHTATQALLTWDSPLEDGFLVCTTWLFGGEGNFYNQWDYIKRVVQSLTYNSQRDCGRLKKNCKDMVGCSIVQKYLLSCSEGVLDFLSPHSHQTWLCTWLFLADEIWLMMCINSQVRRASWLLALFSLSWN